jgi:hypothetical protein
MSPTLYYATLYDQRGVLGRCDGVLTFLDTRTGETTVIEPYHCRWVTDGDPVPAGLAPALLAAMRGQHDHLACCMGG